MRNENYGNSFLKYVAKNEIEMLTEMLKYARLDTIYFEYSYSEGISYEDKVENNSFWGSNIKWFSKKPCKNVQLETVRLLYANKLEPWEFCPEAATEAYYEGDIDLTCKLLEMIKDDKKGRKLCDEFWDNIIPPKPSYESDSESDNGYYREQERRAYDNDENEYRPTSIYGYGVTYE
jgi:hypothetical protein